MYVNKGREDNERGAIVVEATLSLTAFVFAIFMILSVVNICYIQARISLALNSAAKDISQYCYLYYKLGADGVEKDWYEQTEDSNKLAKDTIDGIGEFINSMSETEQAINDLDFEAAYNSIESGIDNVDSLVTQYADKLAEDPKGFIIGMGKLAGNELKEEAKVILGKVMAKAFMKKNLKSYPADSPDDFLRRYHVVDGMNGLDFDYTTLMAYGSTDKIQLTVTYEVSVIRLLNIDFKFKFRQSSQTVAWGNGISLMEEDASKESVSSIWDMEDTTKRGKIIIEEERKKYIYTAKRGFDAYDNSGGKNEFISIITVNTHDKSYTSNNPNDKEAIDKMRRRASDAYSNMYTDVRAMKTDIKVKTGTETMNISSDKETRTYRVIMVVPEDTEPEVIEEVRKKFEEKHSKNSGVVLEIKKGYGVPADTTED